MKPKHLRLLMNLWPPFLASGIRVLAIAGDWSRVRVRLRRHWYNANYVGTHFGGSLFAMTDPFPMLMLMHRLGRDYLVWDRAAEIEFVAAVRRDVFAEFAVDAGTVAQIRAAAADGGRHLRWFHCEVRTADGETVARVRKQLYFRLKPRARGESAAWQKADC